MTLSAPAPLCVNIEQVSDILKSYTDGKITADKAKQDISKVDNLNLIDIDENNIDDVLYFAMEDAKAVA